MVVDTTSNPILHATVAGVFVGALTVDHAKQVGVPDPGNSPRHARSPRSPMIDVYRQPSKPAFYVGAIVQVTSEGNLSHCIGELIDLHPYFCSDTDDWVPGATVRFDLIHLPKQWWNWGGPLFPWTSDVKALCRQSHLKRLSP